MSGCFLSSCDYCGDFTDCRWVVDIAFPDDRVACIPCSAGKDRSKLSPLTPHPSPTPILPPLP